MSLYSGDSVTPNPRKWGALQRAMRGRQKQRGAASAAAKDASAELAAQVLRLSTLAEATTREHELTAALGAMRHELADERSVREARIVADQSATVLYTLQHEGAFKCAQERTAALARLDRVLARSTSAARVAQRALRALAPGSGLFPECDAYVGVLQPGADAIEYVAATEHSTMGGRQLPRGLGPTTWRAVDRGATQLVGHVPETALKAAAKLHRFRPLEWRERQEALRQRRRLRDRVEGCKAEADAAKMKMMGVDQSTIDKMEGKKPAAAAAAAATAERGGNTGKQRQRSKAAAAAQADADAAAAQAADDERLLRSDATLGIPPLERSHERVIGDRRRQPFLAIPIRRPGGDAVLGVLACDAFMTGARRAAAIENRRSLFFTDFETALRDTVLYRLPDHHQKLKKKKQEGEAEEEEEEEEEEGGGEGGDAGGDGPARKGGGSGSDGGEAAGAEGLHGERPPASLHGQHASSAAASLTATAATTTTTNNNKNHGGGGGGGHHPRAHPGAADLAVKLQRGYVAAVNDVDAGAASTGKSLCEAHLYTLGWEGEKYRPAASFSRRELGKGMRWFDFERNVLLEHPLGPVESAVEGPGGFGAPGSGSSNTHNAALASREGGEQLEGAPPTAGDVAFAEQVAARLGAVWWDARVGAALARLRGVTRVPAFGAGGPAGPAAAAVLVGWRQCAAAALVCLGEVRPLARY